MNQRGQMIKSLKKLISNQGFDHKRLHRSPGTQLLTKLLAKLLAKYLTEYLARFSDKYFAKFLAGMGSKAGENLFQLMNFRYEEANCLDCAISVNQKCSVADL